MRGVDFCYDSKVEMPHPDRNETPELTGSRYEIHSLHDVLDFHYSPKISEKSDISHPAS